MSKRAEIHEQLAELGYFDTEPESAKEEAEKTDTADNKANTLETGNDDMTQRSSSQSETDTESHVSTIDSTQPKAPTYRKEADVKREQQLIKALKDKESELPDPDLLTTWYKLDENSMPKIYRLQTIR